MSFLRRLLGGGEQQPGRYSGYDSDQRPSWMRDGMDVQLYEGREDLEVVGEASYQDNLWRIVGGRSSPNDRARMEMYAVLVAEPDNPYDANAVSVWVKGLKVGYLSREDARRYRPGLLALEQKHGKPIALAGAIVGGGIQADGPGRLGVFLDHDPADFGLRPVAPPRSSGSAMWTGLSDAVATDEADESYDLSWMASLPVDDLRAIKMLRQLLERESDAIDRHFMHAHLEALLYRSREVFASALDEYDQVCRHTTPKWRASGRRSWASGARCRCLRPTGRWPSASRRPRTSSRRCGGQSAASPSMGPTVLGRSPWRTCKSGRTTSKGS
jgi:hypothetical protein